MKRLYLIPIVVIMHLNADTAQSYISASIDYHVSLEPKWQELNNDRSREEEFGGKWVLAGSIAFKKKAKDFLSLTTLHLHWHGPQLENLAASLYKKDLDKKFLPIQENLICDSIWNKNTQTLIFNFKKQPLGLFNTFYIVLTIPDLLECVIQQGKFTVEENGLPEPFKKAIATQWLSFESYHQKTDPLHVAHH